MARIKISGLTRLEDARFCAGGGAHYLGFVQDPSNPAFIGPEAVGEILEWIHGIETVGEFRDVAADEVNRVCDQAGFSMAQLDGNESPEVVAAIEVPVIKRIVIHHDASVEHLRALVSTFTDAADYVLLDTRRTSLWSGEGESLSWRAVRALTAEFEVFLSDDLDASNLEDAVSTMRPFAIDVGPSLESAPGIKHFDRLTAFFDVVREVESL